MAAHRYWRLFISENNGNSNYVGIAELAMATTGGGANVCTGGTPSSSSDFSASFDSPKAFDASSSSYWSTVSNFLVNNGFAWIQYDFGAGNEKDIAEITITAPPTANYTPKTFVLCYSDDNKKWTAQRGWTAQSFTSAGEIKILDATALNPVDVKNRVVKPAVKHNAAANSGTPNLRKVVSPLGALVKHTARPILKTPYSGNYYIQGSTTTLGQPIARRVDLHEAKSGLLVASYHTDSTGQFRFDDIGPGPWNVVGIDNRTEQRGVIYTNVMAAAQ